MTDGEATKVKKSRKADPERMGREPIGKLLVEFSIPSIVMMIFNTLYVLIDTIVLQYAVPGVGPAVTQLAFPVMCVLMGLSVLAGIGGNAMAAIEMGKGNLKLTEKILGNTALLLFGFGVLAAIVGTIFINPLLALLGTTEELWQPAKVFIQIVMVGFALQSLGMGLNNFLRTAGKPNYSLATSVLGTVACIVFNIVLVLLLGLGVAGSAFATIIGQGIGMVPVVIYFAFSPGAPFHLRPAGLVPDVRLMFEICSLGMASFIMQVGNAVVTIVFNHVVAKYGVNDPVGVTNALAVVSVAFKVISIAYTICIGVTAGAQPILGFNYGARQWDRVIKALKLACFMSAGLATVCWVVLELATRFMLTPFHFEGEVLTFAITAMRIIALLLPFVGYQMMSSSYFQSSGQPVKATVLELTRQVIFLIPLYLVFPPIAMNLLGLSGLTGVLMCIPLSDSLATILTTIFVVLEVRKLRAWRAKEQAAE